MILDFKDGRIKSAAGIGTLLEDGIGDTIRVSLTEDPEFEIPVCKDLVKRYTGNGTIQKNGNIPTINKIPYREPSNYWNIFVIAKQAYDNNLFSNNPKLKFKSDGLIKKNGFQKNLKFMEIICLKL